MELQLTEERKPITNVEHSRIIQQFKRLSGDSYEFSKTIENIMNQHGSDPEALYHISMLPQYKGTNIPKMLLEKSIRLVERDCDKNENKKIFDICRYTKQLAEVHKEQGNMSEAKQLYFRCMELNPEYITPIISYAKTLIGKSNIEAEELLLGCRNVREKHGKQLIRHDKLEEAFAILYKDTERYEDAIKVMKNTKTLTGKVILGDVFVKSGRIADAEKTYLSGVKQDRTDRKILGRLVRTYILKGDLTGAGRLIREYKGFNFKQFDEVIQQRLARLVKYNIETIYEDIKKYEEDNRAKEFYRIFNGDSKQIVEEALKKIDSIKPLQDIEMMIYQVPYANAGFLGGQKGEGERLDYVTIIKVNEKLIEAYPSDGKYRGY